MAIALRKYSPAHSKPQKRTTNLTLAGLPEDGLIFRCLMTSIAYHILLVIAYFTWYILQRRYTAKHFKEDNPVSSSESAAFKAPQAARSSDEHPPFSPRQVHPIRSTATQTRGGIRQRDSDLDRLVTNLEIPAPTLSTDKNPTLNNLDIERAPYP